MEHPRGSIVSPVKPYGEAYRKRVDATRYGAMGCECVLCGRPIRGKPRYYIAIDLGDCTLFPASTVRAADLWADFNIDPVGSTCAKMLRGLDVLRGPDGDTPVDSVAA